MSDGSGVPVPGAEITLRQFPNPTCSGVAGLQPPESSDTAGRFIFYPEFSFYGQLDGCVIVRAQTATVAASDSILLPLSFRTAPPHDSIHIELTLP